ncbi:MAG: c-type cytochrome [Hyphomicrobiaceae bacterium]
MRAAVLFAFAMLFLPGDGLAQADDEHLGLTEYELACMPCHGVDGHGDGPSATNLTTPPPDLTQIARSNGGRFPSLRIRKFIDGRADVAAHGAREMPVWGDRYRLTRLPNETRSAAERRTRARINALVRYVEGLQR